MRKTKTKSRGARKTQTGSRNAEQGVAYQKPALRSDAFARALTDAKSYASNPEDLSELFNKAASKGSGGVQEPFKRTGPISKRCCG
jgi:hypothetical protein